jgi:hypothetical protein
MSSMNGGAATVYNALGFTGIIDPAGRAIGDYTGTAWQTERIWLGDRQFAWYCPIWANRTEFFHVNALGTTTMNIVADGTIYNDQIFYPWGQPWSAGANDEIQQVAQSLCLSDSAACNVDNGCSHVKYVSLHCLWRMSIRTNRSDERVAAMPPRRNTPHPAAQGRHPLPHGESR